MKKKLKILGHTYDVIHSPNLMAEQGTVAQLDTNTLKITINESSPTSKKEEGLMHEIVEALNHHMEMNLPHPKIMQLGEGLYQVLKDNKMLKDL